MDNVRHVPAARRLPPARTSSGPTLTYPRMVAPSDGRWRARAGVGHVPRQDNTEYTNQPTTQELHAGRSVSQSVSLGCMYRPSTYIHVCIYTLLSLRDIWRLLAGRLSAGCLRSWPTSAKIDLARPSTTTPLGRRARGRGSWAAQPSTEQLRSERYEYIRGVQLYVYEYRTKYRYG